jgi:hypothetical protein
MFSAAASGQALKLKRRREACNAPPCPTASRCARSSTVRALCFRTESLLALLRSDSGDAQSGRPGLDCLCSWRSGCKTLVYEGWKSLDFLGFSRPDRVLSMGCARFSLEKISRALFCRRVRTAASATKIWLAEGTDWSSGKPSLISNLLQTIVDLAVSFQPLASKSNSP